MTSFTMKLAEIPFGVTCLFESTRTFCREYLTGDVPCFTAELTHDDIDREREISRQLDIQDGVEPCDYSDNYLEVIALHRKLAKPLLQRNCIIFHGAVVAVDGEAYLFTAKSGTGKTTHTNLWTKNIRNSYILNGDKPLIKIENGYIMVCGTPWRGKEGYGVNESVPLKALCILERNTENTIVPVTLSEAFPVLYQQTYHLEDAEDAAKTLCLLDRMGQRVKLFRLGCNMEDEAALVSYRAMSRQ